ncbi:hypothetical protein V1477_006487 [Vespula maculifrons]|uniref:Uncharacterized protein n=1 Tax=Vespula maculifrons TaxID=7453 RepID=A0ABD2CJ01_VESMC
MAYYIFLKITINNIKLITMICVNIVSIILSIIKQHILDIKVLSKKRLFIDENVLYLKVYVLTCALDFRN